MYDHGDLEDFRADAERALTFGESARADAPVMQAGSDLAVGPLLTARGAAERLKVSTATVYALCEAGRLAFVRISTHAIRIAEADLVAYLDGRRFWELASRPRRT